MKITWSSIALFAVACLITFLCFSQLTNACTDFQLSAKDGTILVARSMEFATDLQSNLRTSPRGRVFTAVTPNGKPGMSWRVKYGYLYLDGFKQDMTIDGMNEAGLTFEALYLPGETTYQSVPDGQESFAVPYFHIGDWILANFSSVAELRTALNHLYVYQQQLPGLGNTVFPMHGMIHDATGKAIVIEFYNNKINVYDYVGVGTNSPKYNWQVTNLRNYLNLTPYNPNVIAANGLVFSATGQGAGMVGLPGDVSPPSRFVKTAFMTHYAYPANDAPGALNLAQHIINNVDIPAGVARATSNGKETSDETEWVVFKDMTHKMFYYRTYNNMTLRAISLAKLDFSENAKPLKMPLDNQSYLLDVTKTFQQAQTR